MDQTEIDNHPPPQPGRDKTKPNNPSSPRRIAASRANGSLSKGPLTPKSSRNLAKNNRITHGMLAQTVVLNSESQARFDTLLNSFIASYRPITEPEFALVQKMVVAYWRQMRTWSIQKTDFDREMARQDETAPAPFRATLAFRTLSGDSKSLGLALRYETTYERQFSRALRDLAQLKSERDPTAGLSTIPASLAGSTWWSSEEEEEEIEEEEQHPEAVQHQGDAPLPEGASGQK